MAKNKRKNAKKSATNKEQKAVANAQTQESEQHIPVASLKAFDFASIFQSQTSIYLDSINKYSAMIGVPKAISTSWRLYNVIAPLYGHKETVQILGAELLCVQALNTMSYYGTVALTDSMQDLNTKLQSMRSGEGSPPEIWSITGYAAAAIIGLTMVALVKDYGIRSVEAKFKAKVTDELLYGHLDTKKVDSQGNTYKGLSYAYTMHSTEAAPFLPTMFKDIGTGARGFNTTFISSTTAFLSGVTALYSIYNISSMQPSSVFTLNNIIGSKILCAGMVALVSSQISTAFSDSNQERNKPQGNSAKLENYLFTNSLFMEALDTGRHMVGVLKRSFDAIRKVEFKTTYLESMMKSWNFLSEKTNTLLDIILVVHKKGSTTDFSKSEASSLFINLGLVYDFLNWSTVNAKELSSLEVTTKRLETYNQNKASGQRTNLHRVSDNEENAIIIRSGLKMTSYEKDATGEEQKVEKIRFNNDEKIPFYVLKQDPESGRTYQAPNRVSFNGKTGLGKSTMLKAIAGLEIDKVNFQGTISYPASEGSISDLSINNIKLIPQEVNFPPATSMLDMLCLLKKRINPIDYLEKKEMPKRENSQDCLQAYAAHDSPGFQTELSASATRIYQTLDIIRAKNDSVDDLSTEAKDLLNSMKSIDPKNLSKEKDDPVKKEAQDFLISCIAYEAQEIFLELGINDRFAKYFNTIGNLKAVQPDWKSLSGGMTKALCIVQVLTSDEKPKILLLDETRGAIDPQNVRNLETVLDKHLPDTMIIEICHPEQDINPKTHPYFTQVLDLNHHKVMERSTSVVMTPTRSSPYTSSPRNQRKPLALNLQSIPEGQGHRSRGSSFDDKTPHGPDIISPQALRTQSSANNLPISSEQGSSFGPLPAGGFASRINQRRGNQDPRNSTNKESTETAWVQKTGESLINRTPSPNEGRNLKGPELF